jgi:hypothetical protein
MQATEEIIINLINIFNDGKKDFGKRYTSGSKRRKK